MLRSNRLTGITSSTGNTPDITQPLLPGRDYATLRIPFGGTVTAAQVTDMQLLAGDDLLMQFDGSFCDARNQFDRLPAFASNSVMKLPLEMIGMKRPEAQYSSTLPIFQSAAGGPNGGPAALQSGVGGASTGQLIFTVAGATNPTYRVSADYDTANPAKGAGAVPRIRRKRYTIGDGVNNILTLPFGTRFYTKWRRLFMKLDAGSIDRVRLLDGENKPFFDRTKTENDDVLNEFGIRDPAAATNYFEFVADSTERGLAELWDTIGLDALQVEVTTSGGGANLDIWLEALGELGAGREAI